MLILGPIYTIVYCRLSDKEIFDSNLNVVAFLSSVIRRC